MCIISMILLYRSSLEGGAQLRSQRPWMTTVSHLDTIGVGFADPKPTAVGASAGVNSAITRGTARP